MTTLSLDNRYVTIIGAPRSILRQLEEITSYFVEGYYHSPSYRAGHWDGREHLLKYNAKKGYHAPIGLFQDICKKLDELEWEYKVTDKKRRQQSMFVSYSWNSNIELRPYQQTAVDSVFQGKIHYGSGILVMPIRSGKTKTAAKIIHRLKAKTLFMVPNTTLLHQSRKDLSDALFVNASMIGDSYWDEQAPVVVSTIQSLAEERKKRSKKYKEMLSRYDLVVFDECHHLTGGIWHKVMMDFDAPYKIGLSATVYLDNKKECERGVIWLKACCGGVRINVSMSDLIKAGYLVRPDILLYPIGHPDLMGWKWGDDLQEQGVYKNPSRNHLISKLAAAEAHAGQQTLIITSRLLQVDELKKRLQKHLGHKRFVYSSLVGSNSSISRTDIIEAFSRKEIQVLVGTIFGEGVDIPVIDTVINAEGGRDIKATIQRMRNLTPSPGKTGAKVIDFMDMTNEYLAKHSRERLKTYRSVPEFKVRVVKK